MFDRRAIMSIVGALLCAGPVLAKVAKTLDPDADGTIDLAEAKNAAGALFDKLDKDHEGTLDIRELHGRVSKDDLAGADPDKDATLTREEYLKLVETKFKAVDKDNDGTLSAEEMKSPAGKALLKLLK